MKLLRTFVIALLSVVLLNMSAPLEAHAQTDLEAYALELNERYLDRLTQEETLAEDELHDELGEPTSSEEVSEDITLQTFILEDDTIELEIVADVENESGDVGNLTFTLNYLTHTAPDNADFEEEYDALVEEAMELYTNESFLDRETAINQLGQPTSISLTGSFELITYSPATNSDVSHEYVVVVLEDSVLSLNHHSQDPERLAQPFDIEPNQLNQLTHTSGVAYEEMIGIFGQPHAVYHNFVQQMITYYWYSDVDENFAHIAYDTDFRDIMINISHSMR